MKYLLVVLSVFLFTGQSRAQENSTAYPQLSDYLKAERNTHGLLLGKLNGELDVNRYLKLYAQQQATKNPGRKRTFMDGPVVFSSTPVDVSASPDPLKLRPVSMTKEPSAALILLGIAAGIAAPGLAPKKYISTDPTPVQQYLQSTYRQHQP